MTTLSATEVSNKAALARRRRKQSRFMVMAVMQMLVCLLILPFAHTFAVAGSTTTPHPQLSSLPSSSDVPPSQHSVGHGNVQRLQQSPSRAVAPLSAVSPAAAAKAAALPDGKKSRRFEVVSRLFFQYATPLLRKASSPSAFDVRGQSHEEQGVQGQQQHRQRQRLGTEDSFEQPEWRRMNSSVQRLSSLYQQERERSRQKRAAAAATPKAATLQKQEDASQAVDHEAWLLSRALLQHQRSALIRTGALRLLNTAIQAFPALLVARLLRLVEAGSAQPLSAALGTALTLLGVLTTKMLVENQYFHQAVECSTQVRGALQGLVFDKALRLPGGGSGVHQPPDSEKKKNRRNNNSSSSSSSSNKLLDLDPPTKTGALGAGGVLNLMQSDASIIEGLALQLHTTWDGLLQLTIYTYLLYRFLGPSVFYGVAVMLTTIPVNSLALRVLARLTKWENEAKDARNKRTVESVTHMKLLKLFGWEGRFADDIRQHRSTELRRHVDRGVVRAANGAISNAVPSLVLVATLSAYARTGQPLVASTIFTAISLFQQLRFPLYFYPILIDSWANGRNAMRRVANFLSAEEAVSYVTHMPVTLESGGGGGGSIEMKHGNFLWSVSQKGVKTTSTTAAGEQPDGASSEKEEFPLALANVNLKVNPGEFVAVVGGVGSGKTALVKGLLGELNPVPSTIMEEALHQDEPRDGKSGDAHFATSDEPMLERSSVVTQGNVAYCSQEAWLPKGTIRDAIVFGREYDESRYQSAIYDAGLDKDIVNDEATLDANKGLLSHETDVGEGGSSLSGGQRARVALARALYAGEETKVFLLDDCLAALDASVGSTVFERLTRRLRAQKAAVVLVTNDPSLPRRCDRVILMGKVPSSTRSCSTIIDVGTYDELLSRGHDLRSISAVGTSESINKEEMKDLDKEDSVPKLQHPKGRHANDNVKVKSQNVIKIQREPIHVSGGGLSLSNGTENAGCLDPATCHADPEFQASMEICPDSIPDSIGTVVAEVRDMDDILTEEGTKVVSVYNDTISTFSKLSSTTTHNAVQKGTDTVATVATTKAPSRQKRGASADESMSSGSVPFSTYVGYLKSVRRPVLVAAMLASFLTVNGAQFFQQLTVARWSEIARGDATAAVKSAKYMRSLVNAAGVVSLFLWLRSFFLMKVGVRASRFLYSRMLSSVFAAPMSFFDATPSGQLLSRFGREIETVDKGVPDSIGAVLFCFLQIFTSVGALAGAVTPALLIPLLVVGFLYAKAMSLFRPAARDLKRAETITRSPIYTHFGEALRGSETIRSVPGAKDMWSVQHRGHTDKNLGVFYTLKSFDRWLATRLETLGNTVVFISAVASVFLARAGQLKAGSAGWGLTQSLSVTGLLTWAVRCLTDLETNMMSVVRVKELTDLDSEEVELKQVSGTGAGAKRQKMPKEPAMAGEALGVLLAKSDADASLTPLDQSSALVKSGWPWRGNIAFNNVSMRYNPTSPLILRGVTLDVPAGTTLGVVGRTGSGKSSLLLTLFRLVEIEGNGRIEVDGVDIRSVRLADLRRSLAIIPQDPTLFQGSIAYNLDATGESSEKDMWEALEAASPDLAKQFQSSGEGLETHVTEGGKNLSVGQRQLICLARALLRKSRILVLDEATSSVDSKTDQEVQATIRREFVDKGVTVITVAHRLDTVLGYDKIAVLGAGELLEYGSPDDLLKVHDGELRRLVNADRRNKRKGAVQTSRPESLVSA